MKKPAKYCQRCGAEVISLADPCENCGLRHISPLKMALLWFVAGLITTIVIIIFIFGGLGVGAGLDTEPIEPPPSAGTHMANGDIALGGGLTLLHDTFNVFEEDETCYRLNAEIRNDGTKYYSQITLTMLALDSQNRQIGDPLYISSGYGLEPRTAWRLSSMEITNNSDYRIAEIRIISAGADENKSN